MCEPTTVSLAMAGMQAATTIAGGFAAAQEGRYQAKLARIQGQHEFEVGVANAERARYSAERGTASLRARIFSAGVDPTSESAVATIAEDRGNRFLDELTAFYQGRQGQWQNEVRALNANRAGKTALYESLMSAGQTLLTSAVKDDWFRAGSKLRMNVGG